ncbi:NFACT RNA binding domain-containing protein [soil metagenome]
MRIPYDSLCLKAVVEELQSWVGGRVRKVRALGPLAILLELRGPGDGMFLISADPQRSRAHFVTRIPDVEPTPFGQILRKRIEGMRLVEAVQIGGDRILELRFSNGTRLVAEMMGKHANVVLIEPDGRATGAMKWVGRGRSVRPVLPGQPYEGPPSVSDAPSPFARKLAEARGVAAETLAPDSAVFSPGAGGYPTSVAALGLREHSRTSYSVAAEQAFSADETADRLEARRRGLRTQLARVRLSREVAVADLGAAESRGDHAAEEIRRGEALMAYSPVFVEGQTDVDVQGFDGAWLKIAIDPTLTAIENAELIFVRAKKARRRLEEVRERLAFMRSDLEAVLATLEELETADDRRLDGIEERVGKRGWLHRARTPDEERAPKGPRIGEVEGPRGVRVLYGETAEANDHLVTRIAKPNDWWLHVRGATSAHVIVVTEGKPEKTSREQLEFAARIAAQRSAQKHSGMVAVDYTLRKYVRKSKGAAPGSVTYEREKTLHVEPGR